MNQKVLRLVILCLLASSLVLSACGRGGSDEPEPTEPATEAPTEAPAPTEEPTATPEPAEESTETSAEESEVEAADASEEEAETAEAPESPLQEPESPLPVPQSPLDMPISPPQAPENVPAPQAEPSDTAGSVMGAIIVLPAADGEPYRPVANEKIALASVLEREGIDVVAGYEPSIAPAAQSDDYGRFALNDVPPGKWALILDMVINQHLLLEPETGNGIVIEVVEGEVVDLGTITYDLLPISGFE